MSIKISKASKLILKILSGLLISFILIFASLLLALQNEGFRLWLVNNQLPKISANLGYNINIISAQTPSWQEWNFEEISVSKDQQKILLLKNFSIKYNITAIFKNKVAINYLTADKVDFNVPKKDESKIDDRKNTHPSSKKLLPISIENFEVKELSINDNSANPIRVYLRGNVEFLTQDFPIILNLKITNLDKNLPISAEIISKKIDEEKLNISGDINFYQSKISIDGYLTKLAANAKIIINSLDIAQIGKIIKQDVKGKINGQIGFSGSYEDLAINANFDGDAIYKNLPISFQTQAKYQKEQISATLNGSFNLANLKKFLPESDHQIKGDFSTQIKIFGNAWNRQELLKNLAINAEIKKGYYLNQLSGFAINNLAAQFKVEEQKVKIINFTGNDNQSGKISVFGEVDLKNKKLSSQLKIQNYQIVKRPEVVSKASGDLAFNGSFTEPSISGLIDLGPSVVMLDKINFSKSKDKNNDTKKDSQKSKAKAKLDIEITANQQNQVIGRGLNANFAGKIKVYGDSSQPKYKGNFDVTKGYYQFLDTRFDITKGAIGFDDSKNFNFTALANHKKNDLEIIAEIVASNDQFKTNFKSNPKMSFGEIICYITFGKASPKLNLFEGIRLAKIMLDLKKDGIISENLLP